MITLPLAEKLHLLACGEQVPASQLRYPVIKELIDEDIVKEIRSGLTKRTLYIADQAEFSNYLYNSYAITSLQEYIATLKNAGSTRADLVQAGADSKIVARRSFKGFLVNTFMPIECSLNGNSFLLQPQPGAFRFIYDYERFVPARDVVIVGVENAENFRQVEKQKYLFQDLKPLFISRYPQQQYKDVIRWLQSTPNTYLHLGDYDLAGINIYLQEYKRHLGDRASFFVPPNIEELIERYGNKALYDQQQLNRTTAISEPALQKLVSLINKHRKGLEQEALLLPY